MYVFWTDVSNFPTFRGPIQDSWRGLGRSLIGPLKANPWSSPTKYLSSREKQSTPGETMGVARVGRVPGEKGVAPPFANRYYLLTNQFQSHAGSLVGLRQHADRCLLQKIIARELSGTLSHIGIADTRVGG